jgi:hypothetical protein
MDRDRFDALTRLLASSGSRRAALGALLGAGLVGASLDALAKKNGKKDRGQAKDKRTKKRKQQRKNRARAEAAAGCCKSGNCAPGTGKNLTRCCFEGQILTKKSFKSSNLTEANFTGANLTNANFASTNMTRACLVGATITGANFKSANLSGVIRCRTITDTGEDNSGCHLGTPCCPTCTSDAQCGADERCCDGRCIAGACCGDREQGTCASGELCCDRQCVSGVCCDAADCRPRGNLCVSAGGGPTSCICGGTGGRCAAGETCCPLDAGPSNAGACANLQTSATHCGRCGNACGPNFVCDGGQCVCPTPAFKLCGTACIPAAQCCDDDECPVCQQCTSTGCQNAPDRTVACTGSPLEPVDQFICTPLFEFGTGICVGGACICGDNGVYDATANICRCGAGHMAECAAEDCDACEVNSVCFVAGGPIGVLGVTCSECNVE